MIPENSIICFKQDTKERKRFFKAASFAHPAKMILGLQIYLIENYTKPGDTILDPMAGSGTVLTACALGRNVICVELEQKFIKMLVHNLQKIKSIGPMLFCDMGKALILWGDTRDILRAREHPYQDLWLKYPKLDIAGVKSVRRKYRLELKTDARNLDGLLADNILFSPPYAESEAIQRLPNTDKSKGGQTKYIHQENSIGNLKYGNLDEILRGNRNTLTMIDCGEAFFQGKRCWTQGESVHIVFASFSGKFLNKFEHKFSVFSLDLEIWNKFRQQVNQIIISRDSISINDFIAKSALPCDIVVKLRKSLTNPQACLFIAHTDLQKRTQPSILFLPLFGDIKTAFPINKTSKISEICFLHNDKSNTNNNVCQYPYGEISAVISSPPYAEAQEGGGIAKKGYQGPKHTPTDLIGKRSYMPSQHGKTKGQIGNLPYGKADAVITSPPYSDIEARDRSKDKSYSEDREKKHAGGSVNIMKGYQVDAVITSPPYEGSLETSTRNTKGGISARDPKLAQTGTYSDLDESVKRLRNHGRTDPKAGGAYGRSLAHPYSPSDENIGNLKSENYLEAMLQVYHQCHKVLKEKGLMILVVKNFIRDKKVIRLDLDTIKICEKAGFNLKDILKRKLTSQSFWRTIYHNKYPDVEKIEYEDVLVFERAEGRPVGLI